MYDGVHVGHRFLIDFLYAQGVELGLVPTVVTFAEHPLSVVAPERAPKLLVTPDRRMELLDQTLARDVIVLNFNRRMSRMSARSFLKMLHDKWCVDAMVIGFNNRFGRDRAEGLEAYRKIGDDIGVKIISAPEMQLGNTHVSSSVIRGYVADGRMREASDALAHNYTLTGTVVHGQELGRRIGFPTANIMVEDERLLVPGQGVYAAWAVTPDGQRHMAMVNIGFRPTVSEGQEPVQTIEVHILDYQGYLYDDVIQIEFMDRLRGEQKFASPEELSLQLKRDERKVRDFLSV
jgi:riboflavin biosynthesis protein ribF